MLHPILRKMERPGRFFFPTTADSISPLVGDGACGTFTLCYAPVNAETEALCSLASLLITLLSAQTRPDVC